jgi:Zn-dependent peptidase ImmA (M78 family)
MRKHWVINLKSSLVENESNGQFVVAHEIAHAWLGGEEHADITAKVWGFQIPKDRNKVHAE